MDLTYKILILIVLSLVYGCRRYLPETEYAIRQSGEYGSEYVSLLDSYFREDSLRYNSAVFLLNNMPYHMSDSIISEYDDEYSDNFMACLFATFAPTSHSIPKPDCDMSSIETILKPNANPDIRIIRPSFIKENIDASMDLWRNSPYSKSIGWDEFVNYLLPYRASNEPVHYSKSMLNNILKNI